MFRTFFALVLAGVAVAGVYTVATHFGSSNALAQKESAPPGVQMLLPWGGIPAVFEPEFVSADEAEISDDAWVLGVVFNGIAKAYSPNLLNHHEIVNDDFGGHPLAAVW